ncbi:ABC transporter ATP-binding protein [Corynebacterium pacaense]|uniref:ABC transporter ATP-binding protein n=1 Tax=Corynebacterium pacaense TaxID=1816684 RepID=UPI0009BACC27|nr:dipeptide/oligopeptide/nickel ABC transporter ATP-binding protein [Corynebacterium pacaense]
MTTDSILSCEGITKTFRDGNRAVDGVSLSVRRGECLGLVGESGSGKSTLSRCLLGLEQMDAGSIDFGGLELTSLSRRRRRKAQREMQMVFQNPSSSFNSRLRIRDSLLEPLHCYPERAAEIIDRRGGTLTDYAAELMGIVDLDAALLGRYPADLSGGQKQRVAIARALSTEPSLIILDEPTASLDVSVQATVLNLLKDLQDSKRVSYLFISHDLAAVYFMADRMTVMRDGHLLETFDSAQLQEVDRDPYTKQLVSLFSI